MQISSFEKRIFAYLVDFLIVLGIAIGIYIFVFMRILNWNWEYGFIFENYLVNEFFLNHYPTAIAGTYVQNYILFVMAYKLVEFIAVSMVMTEEPKPDADRLVELISHMVNSLDHSNEFRGKVAQSTLKKQKDVVSCMRNLLQAGDQLKF